MMAIAVSFSPRPMSVEQYNETIRLLAEAGAGRPAGRLYHVCYSDNGNLNVFDVWESSELFEQFGTTLMPILQRVGINPGQPVIGEVHNIIS